MDFEDGSAVVVFQSATEGVGHQLLGQVATDFGALLHQERLQFRRALERLATGQDTGRLDGELTVLLTETTDGVEVLEGEAERVHLRVTVRARRIRAVLFHALAKRSGQLGFVSFGQLGNVRGGRRRRCAENLFENPAASLDR